MTTTDNKVVKNSNLLAKPTKNTPKIVISRNSKLIIKRFFHEDVLYDSTAQSLLAGPPHSKLTVTNRVPTYPSPHITVGSLQIKSNSHTVAKLTGKDGSVILEKNSDRIVKAIGQKNYDIVFSALSLLNEDLKIRGIMAMLTENKTEDRYSQTEVSITPEKLEDKCCQTEENSMDLIFKMKSRKRIKRSVPTPYVVKDVALKKVIVDPVKCFKRRNGPSTRQAVQRIEKPIKIKCEAKVEANELQFPLLQLNEDSNLSSLSNISKGIDLQTTIQLLNEHTAKTVIRMLDGSDIRVPVKPEDKFHYATPDILRSLNSEDRHKLLCYQAYVDWKYCLQRDEDGNLPIHAAVLSNDIELLKRQCFVLKNRQESLDLVAENMTPLQMSIYQDSSKCTELLLQYGADPLLTDEEHKTCLHLASEGTPDHLRAIVNHCRSRARDVLENHSDLWKPDYETESDDALGVLLLNHICTVFDYQGYTPLMLASKMGNYANAKILLEAAPHTVNVTMPNCGNTALYLAVSEAHLDSINRGNKSKIADHYLKTLEILMDAGADPSIENYAGSSINFLLQEFCNAELSMLISNKLTAVNFFDGSMPSGSKNFDSMILIKDVQGNINISDVTTNKSGKKSNRNVTTNTNMNTVTTNMDTSRICTVTTSADSKIGVITTTKCTEAKITTPVKEKPIILENITLTPGLVEPLSLGEAKLIRAQDNFVLPTIQVNSGVAVTSSGKPNELHIQMRRNAELVLKNVLKSEVSGVNSGKTVKKTVGRKRKSVTVTVESGVTSESKKK